MTPQKAKKSLELFMLENGVNAHIAKQAADNCIENALKNALGAGTIATLIGYATGNPGALLMGATIGAGAGAITILKSPSCKDVRSAAFEWAKQGI